MAKYMDQNLFDSGAYALATVYVDEKIACNKPPGSYKNMINMLDKNFKRPYRGDNYREEWEQLVPELDNELINRGYFSAAEERVKAFHLYSVLAGKFNPDGSKVKKLFGFFGGTAFSKSHPNVQVRSDTCKRNITYYYVLGVKYTIGSDYFDRQE